MTSYHRLSDGDSASNGMASLHGWLLLLLLLQLCADSLTLAAWSHRIGALAGPTVHSDTNHSFSITSPTDDTRSTMRGSGASSTWTGGQHSFASSTAGMEAMAAAADVAQQRRGGGGDGSHAARRLRRAACFVVLAALLADYLLLVSRLLE